MSEIEDFDFGRGYQSDEPDEPSPFLEKMEAARRARPCPMPVDMRGKVPGICRAYEFGERTFYMDEASQLIFERKLLENDGVFTQGAYEEIINGPHTLKAIRRKREESMAQQALEPEQKPRVAFVDFGFQRKRQQERYELASHLVVFTKDNSYYGTTKDISENGLYVLIPLNYSVKSGDTVTLTFYDERNDIIHEEDLQALPRIPYEVLRVIEKGDRLALALQRVVDDKDDQDLKYLQEVISQRQKRMRLDTKSIISNRSSQVYERYYADSSIPIPLYYQMTKQGPRLAAVGVCAANQYLHQIFNIDNEGYDYAPLSDNRWLPQMIERCLQQDHAISCVITLFRTKGAKSHSLHIISSEQLSSLKSLSLLWATLDNAELVRIFRLTLNPAKELPEERRSESLAPMKAYSFEEMANIADYLSDIKVVGSLLDITDSLHKASYQWLDKAPPMEKMLHALQQQFTNELLNSYPESIRSPERIFFGYLRQRREERYLIEMALTLKIYDESFQAESVDLSTRGLRIRVTEGVAQLYHGQHVEVTFDSLLKHAPKELKSVKYRIVKVLEEGVEFALVRSSHSREDFLIDEFFNSLISRNKERLDVEIGDVRDEILCSLYEGLLVADLQSLPLYLGRDEKNRLCLANAAVTVEGNGLLDYLQNSKKQLDLAFVDNHAMLSHIQRGLKESLDGSVEVVILSYRSVLDDELVCAADFEIAEPEDRAEFIRQMVRHQEYRVLQLSITSLPHYTDEDERRILAPIYSQSMSHAKRLQQRLSKLWAVGEMNDITREYLLALRTPSLNMD